MTQAQAVRRPAAPAKRGRGRLLIATPGKAGDVAFPMSVKSAGRLARHKRSVAKLLQAYAKAADDAERSGQAMQLNITVAPEAAATIVAVTQGDALDAALARAEARGAEAAARLLSADDMLTADAFAARIDATRETVHQKRRRGEVLGLEGAKRGVRFPAWQLLDGQRLLPGLPQVFRAFNGEPWAVYRFLLQAHPELGGASGLDSLKAGQVDKVLAVAGNIALGVPA